jgi:hypothetical protein
MGIKRQDSALKGTTNGALSARFFTVFVHGITKTATF